MDLKYKTFSTEIKAEGDTRSMHFLISTDSVDRDEDVLDPKGWELDRYKANPVVMFAHDYKALPVAKCTAIHQTGKGLEATAEFPPKGTYAFADTVYDMLKAGFLNSTSVGFRPIDYEQARDRKGYNFKKQELTEFSIVPIPSNPDALVQQRGAAGPDVQTRTWVKSLTDWAKAQEITLTPAMKRFLALLPDAPAPWGKHGTAWEDLEKDYNVEAESGELPVARVAKLLALHGFAEEASTLMKADTQANTAMTAQRHLMDAYANLHHADTVMCELCNAGDSEEKAMNGSHMGRAREAHGAIGRAKGHALAAADCLGQKFSAADIAKALSDAAKADEASACVLRLIDAPDDPDKIQIKDDVMRDALASLGPELAALIAGQTRAALNQMRGRID